MKYSKTISYLICFLFILSSCEKESIDVEDVQLTKTEKLLLQYPKEITIDNWEKFVYAPMEVINHFQNIELKQLKTEQKLKTSTTLSERLVIGNFLLGEIQVQGVNIDTENAFLANTRVTITGNNNTTTTGLSFSSPFQGQNYVTGNVIGDMCFFHNDILNSNYGDDWFSGITTLDIVLIQKHILGLNVFKHKSQYLAADVNGDGKINGQDIITIRKLLLGKIDALPTIGNNSYNQPVIYIEQDLYDNTQLSNPIGDFPFNVMDYDDFSCKSNDDLLTDRYAIKRGDVSGSWNWSSY